MRIGIFYHYYCIVKLSFRDNISLMFVPYVLHFEARGTKEKQAMLKDKATAF
jgi:hypothetical protein